MTLSAIEQAYSNGRFSKDTLVKKLTFLVDRSIPGVYAQVGKVIDFALSNETFDRSKVESFIREEKPYTFKDNPGDAWRLEDIFEAEELYQAYPQLKDILVAEYSFEDEYSDASGFVRGNTIHLNTKESQDEKHLTILHEIQHVIQKIEGFSRGTNENASYRDFQAAYEYLRSRLAGGRDNSSDPRTKEEREKIKRKQEAYEIIAKRYKANPEKWQKFFHDAIHNLGIRRPFLYIDDVDLYNMSAGEVEARAVEKRAYMNAKERHNNPFNNSLDIPYEKAIVVLADIQERQSLKQHSDTVFNYSLISDHLQSWQRDPVATL